MIKISHIIEETKGFIVIDNTALVVLTRSEGELRSVHSDIEFELSARY